MVSAESKAEQRAAIRFCHLLDLSATDTFHLLKQAYGVKAVSRATVFQWHR